MALFVLGTHVSHNGSACLLRDGKIVVAIEKERLTRLKHDGGNDNEAVEYCLRAAGITIRDVELVVQNANFDMFQSQSRIRTPDRIADGARNVVTISHHLAHAYSGIGTAPFDEMAVLVIDGCGNCYGDCIDKEGAVIPETPPSRDLEQLYFEKDSYYYYESNGTIRTVMKDFSPAAPRQKFHMYPVTTMHSIGGAYLGVSIYVFGGLEDPGKLMGLAPYGRPSAFDFEMFTLRDGRVFLRYDWMKEFNKPSSGIDHFKNNFQYYADLAHHVQREIERALLYIVSARYEAHPARYLAYAGGVALNAVANRLIRTKTKFADVYFQPAAGDNGLAIGAAYYGWLTVLGKSRVKHDRTSHFGRTYSSFEIETALKRCADQVEYRRIDDPITTAADLLASGKVIGWYQYGSEFGPRALGHRSILASPTNPEVKDFINKNIKFREDFRPFAPSVLAEEASKYFEMDYESPYMILIADTREEWKAKLPAIVHRDGSARVQTVHEDVTPQYYRLHVAVAERTGLPVLLNTSLNRRGMPIVETPDEAISLFLQGALDALVMGDWLVSKKKAERDDYRPSVREILRRIGSSLETSRDQEMLSGRLRLIVKDIEEAWTIDLGGTTDTSMPDRSTRRDVDHTVVITYDGLLSLVRDPSAVSALRATGTLSFPGLAADQAVALRALETKLRRLFSHVRQ